MRESVKFKSGKDSSGNPCLELRTTDTGLSTARLAEAIGTPDEDLQLYLLNQAVQTLRGCVSSEGFGYSKVAEFANNAMALLNGIQPRDEIEGMLAV